MGRFLVRRNVYSSFPSEYMLGSLLFLFFIDDLTSALKSLGSFFPDDVEMTGSTAEKTSMEFARVRKTSQHHKISVCFTVGVISRVKDLRLIVTLDFKRTH